MFDIKEYQGPVPAHIARSGLLQSPEVYYGADKTREIACAKSEVCRVQHCARYPTSKIRKVDRIQVLPYPKYKITYYYNPAYKFTYKGTTHIAPKELCTSSCSNPKGSASKRCVAWREAKRKTHDAQIVAKDAKKFAERKAEDAKKIAEDTKKFAEKKMKDVVGGFIGAVTGGTNATPPPPGYKGLSTGAKVAIYGGLGALALGMVGLVVVVVAKKKKGGQNE